MQRVLNRNFFSTVDEVELEALFEQFKSLSTTKNGIDKETFERCLGPLGVETNLITDRIFKFFDQGKALSLNPRECIQMSNWRVEWCHRGLANIIF